MNSFILEKKLPTLWKEPPLGGRGLAFHRPCQQRKRKGEMLENVGPVRAALSTTFSSGPFSASATDDTARVGLAGGRTSISCCGSTVSFRAAALSRCWRAVERRPASTSLTTGAIYVVYQPSAHKGADVV